MKTWKGYTILDLALILFGLATLTIIGILFGSSWYIIINTLIGLLCVFTQAKAKISTQILGTIGCCFYIFISFTQAYYGEVILYSIIFIPMYIYGIIHWFSNKDTENDTVVVRSNLSKKEWLISSLCFVAISFGVYFLLQAINTAQLWISTFSFISMLPAVYLLIRRCKWNQIAFLINDLICPILWIILIIQGNLAFIPMFVYHIFQIAYDIYGYIVWVKLEKKQAQKSTNID